MSNWWKWRTAVVNNRSDDVVALFLCFAAESLLIYLSLLPFRRAGYRLVRAERAAVSSDR